MPSLSSHSIFQIDKKEYKSFQKDTRRNVVTFKGTEVYVAVGSTVRCAELRQWHAMEDERQGEKCYQVDRLLFRLTLDIEICECDV
jgi:plastocyanin domain-containing protein